MLLAFGTIGELALRYGLGLGRPLLLQKDPDIGYLYQPRQHLQRFGHRVDINSFHQRGAEIDANPAPGKTRILFVGDSVTFGTTLLDQEEILTEHVVRAWRETGLMPVEVLNASAGSWGLGNQLAYLQRFGTFGAKIVVLQIGTHDLLQRASTSVRVGVDPTMPDRNPSLAWGELWERYVRPRLTGNGPPATSRPPIEECPAQFAWNMAALTQALELIRQAGAQPFVVHTPNRADLDPAHPAEDPAATYRPAFLQWLAARQIEVLDLCSRWTEEGARKGYFLDQVHLSAEGARSAAHAFVARVTTNQLLVPPDRRLAQQSSR
jgi:lysophospholipase L1-like esterase